MMICTGCGCSDEQACVWFEALGDGRVVERRCSWAAPGRCSECVDEAEAPRPLLYDAHGAPLVMR